MAQVLQPWITMTLVVIVTNMRSFWSDPYLWIHLAGLAALPLFLGLCFLGLAVGDPVVPVVLEVLFVAMVGITPILWMQWQRPFCIFSLVALAVKPEFLSEQQRRILRLFKGTESQAVAGGTAIALLLLLWQLYRFAPLGTEAASVLPQTRLLGLGLAAIAFLFCNLFLQVPLSVARAMLASDAKLASLTPYPVEQIAQDFTLIGLRVKQIVPPLLADEPKPTKPVAPRPKPSNTPPGVTPAAVVEPDDLSKASPWDEFPVVTDVPADQPGVSSELDLEAEQEEEISTNDPAAEVPAANLFAEEAIADTSVSVSEPEPEASALAADLTLATILESISSESSELESLATETAETETVEIETAEITETADSDSLDESQNITSDSAPGSDLT